MLSNTIVKIPASDDKLILFTDSANCLGACVSIANGLPVASASRKLTESEQKWSTLDKETMAIVWSVEKFQSFLLGREFVTDHRHIQFLFKSDKVVDKVHRWRSRLSDFSFTVEYVKGSEIFVILFLKILLLTACLASFKLLMLMLTVL